MLLLTEPSAMLWRGALPKISPSDCNFDDVADARARAVRFDQGSSRLIESGDFPRRVASPTAVRSGWGR